METKIKCYRLTCVLMPDAAEKIAKEKDFAPEDVDEAKVVMNIKPEAEKLRHQLIQDALDNLGDTLRAVTVEIVTNEEEECDHE